MFNSIDSNQTAEITEKKSKFIANVISVSSKEEAEKCINDIKKKNRKTDAGQVKDRGLRSFLLQKRKAVRIK